MSFALLVNAIFWAVLVAVIYAILVKTGIIAGTAGFIINVLFALVAIYILLSVFGVAGTSLPTIYPFRG